MKAESHTSLMYTVAQAQYQNSYLIGEVSLESQSFQTRGVAGQL